MAKYSTSKTGTDSNISMSQSQFADMVRKKAYELYEKRGRRSGKAMDDWLEAERIMKQKMS